MSESQKTDLVIFLIIYNKLIQYFIFLINFAEVYLVQK